MNISWPRLLLAAILVVLPRTAAPSEKSAKSGAGDVSFQAADRLFDRGEYQEALSRYEALFKSAAGEEKWKAFYRSRECQALLFRYGEAVESFKKEKPPQDGPSRARLLLLKAELYREFLKQYGRFQGEDVVEDEKEVFRRPPSELRADVESAFKGLWELRRELAQRPIGEESYFIDAAKADRSAYPTFLDFAVLRWGEYLLQESEDLQDKPRPEALGFFKEEYPGEPDSKGQPGALAGALFEQASRLDGAGRTEAKELWRLRRLLLPFQYPGRVASLSAQAQDSAIARLKSWMDSLQTPAARSRAGFEAASMLRGKNLNDEALSVCKKVQDSWPGTYGADRCARLAAEIRRPELSLQSRTVPPPGKQALTLNSRNLKALHLRLYPITPQESLDMREWRQGLTWSGALNQLDPKLLSRFLGRTPSHHWVVPVKGSVYEHSSIQADLPDPKPGLYIAMACGDSSCEEGVSLISGAFVNVTEILLVGSVGLDGRDRDYVYTPDGPREKTADAFWFYALDGATGKPLKDAELDIFHGQNGNWTQRHIAVDELGRSKAEATVPLSVNSWSNWHVDPLLSHGGSWAYWNSPMHMSFSPPSHIQLFVETDRPIYRPGQKVGFKVVVTQRIPQGYKTYAGLSEVRVQALDANYQELFALTKKPGENGTLSGEFLIPTGRLLGAYRIQATIQEAGTSFSGSAPFSVEEYKRPEFEVSLKEPKGPWRFGKDALVEGEAKYYFGGPVPDAAVTYTVTRRTYIPWFCWWWNWRNQGRDGTEVLRGDAKTDAEGKFRFTFTPEAQDKFAEDPMPARFQVSAEARDAGGRTIVAERDYTAGKKSLLFSITPSAGFMAGKPFKVSAKLVNLDEVAVAGSGRFKAARLEKDPDSPEGGDVWQGGFPSSPSLDQIYRDVPDDRTVAEGAVSFPDKGEASFELPPLAPGAYRLTLTSSDPWGGEVKQAIVLLSADPKGALPLKIASLALPEHAEYAVGETARVLMGSSHLKEVVHVEVWGGSHLIERRTLPGSGGIRVFELPLDEIHKGGVTLRWFGARDHKIRAGSASLLVPWKEKQLRVKLKHDKALLPGQKASWTLFVKDSQGKPVDAEALLRVYDRSLEYYAKQAEADLGQLYASRPWPQGAQGSYNTLWGTQLPLNRGWIKAMLELFGKAIAEPLPPGLRMNRSRVYGYGRQKGIFAVRGAASDGMVMEEASLAGGGGAMAEMKMAAPSAAAAPQLEARRRADKFDEGMAAGKKKESSAGGPPVQVRKDFSETAAFKPHLRIRQGQGPFSFTAPERLSSWRVSGSVLTQDVRLGRFSEETVTRKELMVRVEMPRFLREGDESALKAVVHNETDSELSGSLSLSVFRDSDTVASSFGLKDLERGFTVKPHSLEAFTWKVSAPRELGSYTVRAVARSGEKVDAEERDLPVLPSRQRLIESLVVALNGDASKTLSLKSLLKKDASRQDELLQLQIDPQLALTVFNSLPFLVHYPHECVEQTLHRYVPLAIVNAIYRRNPAIAKAVSKIPKRSTLTPAWDKDDPKRLMRLMETPWLQQSEGAKSYWPVLDLFDTSVVAREERDAMDRLKSSQLPEGGFPWFPGGRPDPYITLIVLAGLAEAQNYGVEVPQDMVERALRYLMGEMPKHLKPEEGEVAMLLYASYVVTSFPQKLRALPAFMQAGRFAKAWLDFADKHSDAMTQIGKAYAAYAYGKLGDKAKSGLYLDRAMDGSREDPVTGVYWQPEKYSWLWYHDTVETHAFLLRTLQTLRPKDERIPGMVQWLLFSRKGTEWKSTKASAAAIFTLLDFMKGRGALDKGDTYSVRWGDIAEDVQVAPDDWLGKPLRWTRSGADSDAAGLPTVDKKGPGLAFASLTHIYTTEDLAERSEDGLLNVSRKFYRRVKEGEDYHLKPLASGDSVKVGDTVEVQLKINTRSQFEYVHLKDPRGAGFEAEELLSGWKWEQLGRYEEPRDSLTNFFVSWLPHGEYVLKYRVRPTTEGRYRIGSAVIQSMYAPEFAAHSSGFELKVTE